MNGIDAIIHEIRTRPVSGEVGGGEMLTAAQCYLNAAKNLEHNHVELVFKGTGRAMTAIVPKNWPWGNEEWEPSQIVKNNLKRAGALIAGEWDRLDRLGL